MKTLPSVALVLTLFVNFAVTAHAATPDSSNGETGERGLRTIFRFMTDSLPVPPSVIADMLKTANPSGSLVALHPGGRSRPVYVTRYEFVRLQEMSTLKHTLLTMAMSPDGDFALMIDDHNAVFVLDAGEGAAGTSLKTIRTGFSDRDYAAAQSNQRTIDWYITHGWDPPDTRNQALFMGFDIKYGELAEHPAIWPQIIEASPGAATRGPDCLAFIVRINRDAELSAVCRAGSDFRAIAIARGILADVTASLEYRYLAEIGEKTLSIHRIDGRLVLQAPINGDVASATWLTDSDLISYDADSPAIVYNATSETRSELTVRCVAGATLSKGAHILKAQILAEAEAAVLFDTDGNEYDWQANAYSEICPKGHGIAPRFGQQ